MMINLFSIIRWSICAPFWFPDLGVDAYEGEISTDGDKMPSQDKIIDELSQVKDIAESSKEVEDELESLGQKQLPQTAESMNEIVPVKAEEKLETGT